MNLQPLYMYVLWLENDGWYVGSTRQPRIRFAQHFSGEGAVATREHRPVFVERVWKCRGDFLRDDMDLLSLEQYIAWLYVRRFGAHRVRGAALRISWSEDRNGRDTLRRDTRGYFASRRFRVLSSNLIPVTGPELQSLLTFRASKTVRLEHRVSKAQSRWKQLAMLVRYRGRVPVRSGKVRGQASLVASPRLGRQLATSKPLAGA